MGYKIRGNKLYVYGTVDGKFYRLSTSKKATQLNINWIAKHHRDVLLQLVNKDKPKRMEMFMEYAKQSMESNGYAIKLQTADYYNHMFNKHIAPYFKHYRLDEIKPSDVRSWQTKLLKTLSPRTIKNIRNLLGKILGDAVMEEVKVLTGNATGWAKSFITVAFFTGLRTGELLALKWEDIDFHSQKIVIRRTIRHGIVGTTKTGKTRVIDMLDIVHDSLKEKYKENDLQDEFIFH